MTANIFDRPRKASDSRDRRSVRQMREELRHAQKSGAGVPAYTRWINRRLAGNVAAVAAAAGIGPNAVTLLSAAASTVGIVAIVVGPVSFATALCASVLLALGYLLDSADGQVARLLRVASPAGEWLDHVVDAIRTPVIHLGVAVACYLHRPDDVLLMGAALAYAVLSSGQFMSQILAEQLSSRHGRSMVEPSGSLKSVALIPTDPGALCWAFALWGSPAAFGSVYLLLFVFNLLHTAISMQRKHRRLR
jgi:phosphatidylglycerophosphate synthase